MPEVISTAGVSSHPRSFWRMIRHSIYPPKHSANQEGDIILPESFDRDYDTITPAGFEVQYTIQFGAATKVPLRNNCVMRLRKWELDNVVDAWETQILPRVMKERFCAFLMCCEPSIDLVQMNLCLWHVNRQGAKPVVEPDLSGIQTTKLANEFTHGSKWNCEGVVLHIWSIRAKHDKGPTSEHFQKLTTADRQRIRELDPDDPQWTAMQSKSIRWTQHVATLRENVDRTGEYNLARAQVALRRPVPGTRVVSKNFQRQVIISPDE